MSEKYILPLLCATSEHTEIIFLKYISINETFLLILSSIILRWIFGCCRKCCSFLSSLTFRHEMCPWGRAHDYQFLIRCVSHKSEFFLLSSWHIPLIVSGVAGLACSDVALDQWPWGTIARICRKILYRQSHSTTKIFYHNNAYVVKQVK